MSSLESREFKRRESESRNEWLFRIFLITVENSFVFVVFLYFVYMAAKYFNNEEILKAIYNIIIVIGIGIGMILDEIKDRLSKE